METKKMTEDIKKPENTIDTGRNPDGTWKKGFCPNPGGRHKNPLKEFSLKEFASWDDERKRDFLSKISAIDRWKMTEGNPETSQKNDISGTITTINIDSDIANKNNVTPSITEDSSEGQS